MTWHDTAVVSRLGVHFKENCESFLEKYQNFCLNFSKTNQNKQSGEFPVLQEERLERQRSHNVNRNTLKSIRQGLNALDEWQGQRGEARKLEDIWEDVTLLRKSSRLWVSTVKKSLSGGFNCWTQSRHECYPVYAKDAFEYFRILWIPNLVNSFRLTNS